jgi:hypothetical protein
MSVDPPEIRRLAADPYMIATVEIIECFFESMAGQKDLDPAMAGATKEEIVEDCLAPAQTWCFPSLRLRG